MKEGAAGVKRLLGAIYRNADEQTIKTLARCLNYDERQLRDDIADIPRITVIDDNEE